MANGRMIQLGKRPISHMGGDKTLSLRYDAAHYFGHTISGYDFEVVRRFVSWSGAVRFISVQVALREDEESHQWSVVRVRMDGDADWASIEVAGWAEALRLLGFTSLRKALDAGHRNERRNPEALVRALQRDAFQLANERMLRRM